MTQRIKLALGSFGLLIVIGVLVAILFAGSAQAQDFIQGYGTESKLIKGTIVSTVQEDPTRVIAGKPENSANLLGVVVRSDESAITLSSDTSGVYVSTLGKFETLVSNLNGSVEAGDYITISTITGVGMRADSRQETVIGRAVQDLNFTDSNNVLSTTTLTDDAGKQVEVAIGRILVELRAEENPLALGIFDRVPDFLLVTSEQIAGKPVSPVRIYSGLAVLLVSFAIGGSMLYTTMKSSFMAIGRNPLAKRSVMSGLRQVLFVTFLIFGIGLFTVYLILRL